MAGPPKTPKDIGTIRSHRIHYFMFIHAMKLHDDLLLERVPLERCNYTLALYAAHLASGSTLMCKSVKSGTIAGYLRDVARFLANFQARDPRRTDATQTTNAECISGVLAEVKRWELVPNRREPLTVDMYMWLLDHINAIASVHGPDSRYTHGQQWQHTTWQVSARGLSGASFSS